MKLQSAIRNNAPKFCKFVRRVHVFRMEEWSDVTQLIANRPAGPAVTEAEAAENQLVIDGVAE